VVDFDDFIAQRVQKFPVVGDNEEPGRSPADVGDQGLDMAEAQIARGFVGQNKVAVGI